MSESIKPKNVIEALVYVQSNIGGISKLTAKERQERGMATSEGVNYAFRSIEQITPETQRLFSEAGMVVVPFVLTQHVEPIQKGQGNAWTRTTLHVSWRIYGPGGADDMIEAQTTGVADDNSDKGANKALTAAQKNLLLKMLSIGDPEEDPDNTKVPDAKARPQQKAAKSALTDTGRTAMKRAFALAKELGLPDYADATKPMYRAVYGEKLGIDIGSLGDLNDGQWGTIVTYMLDLKDGKVTMPKAFNDAIEAKKAES